MSMWQIITGPHFDAGINIRSDELFDAICASPPPANHVLHHLKTEYNKLNDFLERLFRFLANGNGADPTLTLHRAYEPGLRSLIPNYYVLQENDWIAYFRVDAVRQVAKCVYIRNVHDPLAYQLSVILQSLP